MNAEPQTPAKVMLVTGASSGIGRALARLAAAHGYAVLAAGRDSTALERLAAELRAQGGTVATYAGDLTEPSTPRAIVKAALQAFGRIDVLVNNAGMVARGPLVLQDDDALRAQFGTHAVAPLALAREALPALISARGTVFFVGSGVARVPVGDLGAYPASKAALRSAVTTLGRELRPLGVGVTYVDPGVVDTAFMKRAGMPGAPAWLLISPQDVARTMFRAIAKRPRVLNAVPWQTALVGLAERFPQATEFVLERAPGLVGGGRNEEVATIAPPAPVPAFEPAPVPAEEELKLSASGFETALAPLARRMERLHLRSNFVAGLLVPGARIDSDAVAMQWAGMPNKNERAITIDVLEALAAAGYLEREAESDDWHVIKAAEPPAH